MGRDADLGSFVLKAQKGLASRDEEEDSEDAEGPSWRGGKKPGGILGPGPPLSPEEVTTPLQPCSTRRRQKRPLLPPAFGPCSTMESRNGRHHNQGVEHLVSLLNSPEDAALRGAVLSWLDQVVIPRKGEGQEIPAALELEEFKAMLAKRVEEWNRIVREEGRQEGRQEGEATLLLRQLEQKFGRIDPKTRKRVQSADSERLLDWATRILTAERLEDVFN